MAAHRLRCASAIRFTSKRVVLTEKGSLIVPGSMETRLIDDLIDTRTTDDGAIRVRNGMAAGGGSQVNVDLCFAPTLPSVLACFAPTLPSVLARIDGWRRAGRIGDGDRAMRARRRLLDEGVQFVGAAQICRSGQDGAGKPVDDSFCLIDIKEAGSPAAPRDKDASTPRDNATRIVAGARALSPYLGERMVASRFFDRQVVIRELLPQDLKIEMDRITRDDAVAAARYLAQVAGKAHARQMDAQTLPGELARQRTKALDAPSWLWTSVVDLIASHETAYLEQEICDRDPAPAANRNTTS